MKKEWQVFTASGSLLELTKKLNLLAENDWDIKSVFPFDVPDKLAWAIVGSRKLTTSKRDGG